ncbi:Histidine kinase-, DNA gyrase B-, and HSP90-like ATPase [Bradyrhizobium sp. Rc2d]|uniref:two-component system sensor histidine kinase NtrB n=1 Tax=Bradyrhizobium sp. Rc2d TaxID=1855321 RepID=UPI000885B6E0|nr:ATP-binding protein [Bradyrhizobium sp. Rc2d]SDJ45535.1 Histidine kinase-, DNA gyrase B-, and HSP90-like ATPase [Bradyrhizobium sp. Rc2d]
MQIKETIGVSFPGSVESLPLEDVIVLVDSAGVALGVQRAFSARAVGVRERCVEIPLVGSDGEVSGTLCRASPRSDTRAAVAAGERPRMSAMADVAQFVVHDINNLLAVIGSGLRLLECQSDAACRKAVVDKMQEAIARGALLTRRLLDAARPRPTSINADVAGSRLEAIAGLLDRALRPDITVHTEIAPDLWAFNADPEELYFALLKLCRNSADAMPDGGVITVAARNVESSSAAAREFIEIVVADDGEGMPEEVLSQAFTAYFTTKAAGTGTGLGLAQVRRFAEGRGGAIGIESERGAGTLVRLRLPRVGDAAVQSSIVGTEIACTPSPNGGIFHVVNS